MRCKWSFCRENSWSRWKLEESTCSWEKLITFFFSFVVALIFSHVESLHLQVCAVLHYLKIEFIWKRTDQRWNDMIQMYSVFQTWRSLFSHLNTAWLFQSPTMTTAMLTALFVCSWVMVRMIMFMHMMPKSKLRRWQTCSEETNAQVW